MAKVRTHWAAREVVPWETWTFSTAVEHPKYIYIYVYGYSRVGRVRIGIWKDRAGLDSCGYRETHQEFGSNVMWL